MEKQFNSKQVKLFTRIYDEFVEDYNSIVPLNKCLVKEQINQQLLKKFFDEVLSDFDNFSECVGTENITLFSNIDHNNVAIQWKVIHNLFIVLYKENNYKNMSKEMMKEHLEKSRKAVVTRLNVNKKVNDMTGNVSGIDSSQMGNIMSSMMPLMANLMANNGGALIDMLNNSPVFNELIKGATENNNDPKDILKTFSSFQSSLTEALSKEETKDQLKQEISGITESFGNILKK